MSVGITKGKVYSGEFRSVINRGGASAADAFTIMNIDLSKLPIPITDLCNIVLDCTIMSYKYTVSGRHTYSGAYASGAISKTFFSAYDPTITYPFTTANGCNASPTKYHSKMIGGTFDPDMSFQVLTSGGTSLPVFSRTYYIPDAAQTTSANVIPPADGSGSVGETLLRMDFYGTWGNRDIALPNATSININTAMNASTQNGNIGANLAFNYCCIAKLTVAQPDTYIY